MSSKPPKRPDKKSDIYEPLRQLLSGQRDFAAFGIAMTRVEMQAIQQEEALIIESYKRDAIRTNIERIRREMHRATVRLTLYEIDKRYPAMTTDRFHIPTVSFLTNLAIFVPSALGSIYLASEPELANNRIAILVYIITALSAIGFPLILIYYNLFDQVEKLYEKEIEPIIEEALNAVDDEESASSLIHEYYQKVKAYHEANAGTRIFTTPKATLASIEQQSTELMRLMGSLGLTEDDFDKLTNDIKTAVASTAKTSEDQHDATDSLTTLPRPHTGSVIPVEPEEVKIGDKKLG
jgi:hypothetical protein